MVGGGYREWGLSGLVRIDPGVRGRGWSLNVRPAWGETESGVRELWEEPVNGMALDENGEQPDPRPRVAARIGYGLTAFEGKGLLTPYGSVSLDGGGERRYAVGSRWQRGDSLKLNLEGRRRESANDEPQHGVMLRGEVRF